MYKFVSLKLANLFSREEVQLFKYLLISLFFSLSFSVFGQKINIEDLEESIAKSQGQQKLDHIKTYVKEFYRIERVKTQKYLDQGEVLNQALLDKEFSALQFQFKGEIALIEGEINEAKNYLLKSIEFAKSDSNDAVLARSYSILGRIYYYFPDFEASKIALENAKKYALLSGNPQLDLDVLRELAGYYFIKGEEKNALESYNKLLPELDQGSKDYVNASLNKATVLTKMGDYQNALVLYLKYLKTFKDSSDELMVADLENSVGFCLLRNGINSKALEYFRQAESKMVEQAHFRISVLYLNMSEAFYNLEQFDNSKLYLEKFSSTNDSFDWTYNSVLHTTLGMIAIHENDAVTAKEHFELIEKIEPENQNGRVLAVNYYSLANYYYFIENYETAIKYAEKSLSISSVSGYKLEQIKAFEVLEASLSKVEKFEKAFEIGKWLEEVKSEHYNVERLFVISQKLSEEKLKGSEAIINSLQSDTQSSKKRSIYLAVLSLLLVFGLGGGYFFVTKNYKKIKAGFVKVEFKSEEAQEIIKGLNAIMKKDRLFLNENLTLSEISAAIGLSDKKVSNVLNHHEKTNFFDFVNSFRIEEFIKLISMPENDKYSTEALANDSGFKSRSSFYRAFKKKMGTNPAEYRKNRSATIA